MQDREHLQHSINLFILPSEISEGNRYYIMDKARPLNDNQAL